MDCKKVNILVITQSLGTGGVEKALLEMIKALANTQLKFTVGYFFQRKENDINRREISSYAKCVHIKNIQYPLVSLVKEIYNPIVFLCRLWHLICFKFFSKYGKKWFYLSKSLPFFSETLYDYVIAYHSPADFPVFYSLYNVNAKKKILWIHNALKIDDISIEETIVKQIYKMYDSIVCVSKLAKNTVISLYPELKEKTMVIYNLINENEIKKLSKDNIELNKDIKENIFIVSVGRLSREKGFDLAIKAHKILLEKGYNITWYVCGEGKERSKLEQLINDNNLNKKFILLGNQKNPYKYMAKCDIYCQTSIIEGFCITLQEARILKKAVVTTDFECAKEQIINEVNGLIVKKNPNDIANAIANLIDNPEKRKSLGENFIFNKNKESIIQLQELFV